MKYRESLLGTVTLNIISKKKIRLKKLLYGGILGRFFAHSYIYTSLWPFSVMKCSPPAIPGTNTTHLTHTHARYLPPRGCVMGDISMVTGWCSHTLIDPDKRLPPG